MIVVIALLAVAVAAVLGAPFVLATGDWPLRFPRLALVSWITFFCAGLLAAVGSLAWSIVLVTGMTQSDGSSGWLTSVVLMVFGWTGLAAVGALFTLVFTRLEPMTASLKRAGADLHLMVETAAYRTTEVGRIDVVFVDCELPVAMSLDGKRRRILVTSRVEDELDPQELRSVIEHERAHLMGRHGVIRQVAELNRACVPRLLGAKAFGRASGLLVELIADDAAARVCGPESTANALRRLGELGGDETMLLRAKRIAQRSRVADPAAHRRTRHGLGRSFS
jgi:Zn-dependent protease with chaperone function